MPEKHGYSGGLGKGNSHNPNAHIFRKSDCCIVPLKSLNKEYSAEGVEGRRQTKGNLLQPNMCRTQSRGSMPQGLQRVRRLAKTEKDVQFTALLHHVTFDLLRNSFLKIKKQATPGIDGVTWEEYNAKLTENLKKLHGRIHRGTYKPTPSRRAYIPKPGGGGKRPLGVSALEDKVAQRAVMTVLNQVYEEDFRSCSYGFRPGRNPHMALDGLWMGLVARKVNWVLEADLKNFFTTINHEWMLRFIRHRIRDERIVRLINKWLKAGVMESGQWKATEEGTAQGSSISPLLANVYLHYVLDLWVLHWRKRNARGDVVYVRFADDYVLGFQHKGDAQRFLEDLRTRLSRFCLELHSDKTRLIEFGRFASLNRARRGERKPETFEFLGFKHVCSRDRKGRFRIRRLTIKKRMARKLKEIRNELMHRRHHPQAEVAKWLASVVQGYFNYHAVPLNSRALNSFRTQVQRSWYFALRRRSHKSKLKWERFSPIVNRILPPAKVLHPYPSERFYAMYPK